MEKLRYLRTVRRVFAGLAFLAGSDKDKIFYFYNYINNNKITFSGNPYGDGKSSERIRKIIYK